MRFLGIGDCNDLGDMYIRLAEAGHDVKVFVSDEGFHRKLEGLVTRIPNWEDELPWVREGGRDAIILFETSNAGDVQDDLRRDGFNVVGGSRFGDRLENDRGFGQRVLEAAGLQTAGMHEFREIDAADRFVLRNPRRYVLKTNGAHIDSRESYVGEFDDGSDVRVMLERARRNSPEGVPAGFVLMDHIEGVEVGVGGYFNGRQFMEPVCIDWEHKRFFNGDMGEMTGEMGTLVSYRNAGPLFSATLAKMADELQSSGYVGYINLNTIVNDAGIWPLEFTCRFGYPGFAILDCLHEEGWDELFKRLVRRDRLDFRTHPGFAVGAVLTIPPFPFSVDSKVADGLPIRFREELTFEEKRNLRFDEVRLSEGALVSSGPTGYVMVVTGRGESVAAARRNAYGTLGKIAVPSGRYRTDIGNRFVASDRRKLQELGLWPGNDL